MARGLEFRIKVVEGLYYPCSENKGADHLFVLAYAKIGFLITRLINVQNLTMLYMSTFILISTCIVLDVSILKCFCTFTYYLNTKNNLMVQTKYRDKKLSFKNDVKLGYYQNCLFSIQCLCTKYLSTGSRNINNSLTFGFI